MTFAYRLKEAMNIRRIRAVDLCRITGIGKSLMSQYMSGACVAKQNNTYALAVALNVSEAWLMGYDVPMDRARKADKGVIKLPIYGEVAAGEPIFAEQNIIDYISIPQSWLKGGEYYTLQVTGNSMEPRLYSGDIVIVRRSDEFVSGMCCVVLIGDDGATLKKVQVRENGISLIPLNPDYPIKNFSAEEVQNLPIKCLGVAEDKFGKIL